MKRIFLVLMMFSFAAGAQTQNGQIVKCRVQNPQWSALFILDAIGAGFLQVKATGQTQTHTCSLRLTDLSDQTRGVASVIKIELDRGSCDPEMDPAHKNKILKELALRIDMNNPQSPKADLYWLQNVQPEKCRLEKFNLYDVQMDAKKFREGTWGKRSTASVKKGK